MVLVRVGQHERLDLVQPALQGREVRQDQVNAGLVGLGEQHAAVDDEQPARVFEDGHVAADLAEAAERDHAQAAGGQRRRRPELRVRMTHLSFTPPAVEVLAELLDLGRGGVWQRQPDSVPPGSPSRLSAALVMITPWVRNMPV